MSKFDAIEETQKPHGKRYREYATDLTRYDNDQLLAMLKARTPMSGFERALPQYRQWRRLIVRELLRRGLIHADPGGAP